MRCLRIAVALALAAQSCGPKAPVVQPGQVITTNDATFRTHTGNAIEITVAREWQGHRANGVAMLHGLSLEEAQKSSLRAVAGARAWRAIVEQLQAAEPAAAYDAAKRAIAELGDGYLYTPKGRSGIMDDTGMKLKLADLQATKGDMSTAATYYREVLDARVKMYLRAYAGTIE